jgi:hypothetical protein
MKLFSINVILICVTMTSCGNEDQPKSLATCDAALFEKCSGKDVVPFCLFGYKWGSNNPFPNAGPNGTGPGIGDISVSYEFVEADKLFSTHRQSDLKSLSFEDNILSCTKDLVKSAFQEWSSVAKINFKESTGGSADIKFIIGDITQGGVGYPNFTSKPCDAIKGQIVFKRNGFQNCENAYSIILHEIGHALGLGHVLSDNIMHPNNITKFKKLQGGDIQGIQSIYGKR